VEAVGPSLHSKSEDQSPGRLPSSGNSHQEEPASEQQRFGAKNGFSYSVQDCFTSKLGVTAPVVVVVAHAFPQL